MALDLTAAGATLRRAREAVDISQDRLADAIGMKQSRISEIERGVAPNVTVARLDQLAGPLGYELRLVPVACALKAAS